MTRSGSPTGVREQLVDSFRDYLCGERGLALGTVDNYVRVAGLFVGHVTWQGRPAQPNLLQQLPLTLTLSLGTTQTDYTSQTTDTSGYFTVTVTGLPDGLYEWRVKGPQYLANSGTVPLSLHGYKVTWLQRCKRKTLWRMRQVTL